MCWHSTFWAAEIIRAGLTNPKSRLHPHLLPSRMRFYSSICRGFLTVFFFPTTTTIILGDFLTSYFPQSPTVHVAFYLIWATQVGKHSSFPNSDPQGRAKRSPWPARPPPSSMLPNWSPTPPHFSSTTTHTQSQWRRRLQGREMTWPCLSVRACLQPSAAASPVLREPTAPVPLTPLVQHRAAHGKRFGKCWTSELCFLLLQH